MTITASSAQRNPLLLSLGDLILELMNLILVKQLEKESAGLS